MKRTFFVLIFLLALPILTFAQDGGYAGAELRVGLGRGRRHWEKRLAPWRTTARPLFSTQPARPGLKKECFPPATAF